MTTIDPIADLLTRIRNAQMAGKESTVAPYSKIKEAICKVMKDSKFIQTYSVETTGKFRELSVLFDVGRPALELSRISKPGQRVYVGATEIPRVKNGMGMAIISTPVGIMNGYKAKKAGKGGELICTIS